MTLISWDKGAKPSRNAIKVTLPGSGIRAWKLPSASVLMCRLGAGDWRFSKVTSAQGTGVPSGPASVPLSRIAGRIIISALPDNNAFVVSRGTEALFVATRGWFIGTRVPSGKRRYVTAVDDDLLTTVLVGGGANPAVT